MVHDKQFSLGLSYFEIMDLSPSDLHQFLSLTSREEIIDWLEWNDRNGTYNDVDSLREFGNVMSKDEGIEIVMRQIAS
ncbi:hypothetical protein [Dyadobacter sp. 32]|uniref:hypothetical protein n=1 Tax=Dyadobacter sp. 32 TaxID=538966 RepID=UPI0011ECD45C